jgi:hypothetical protein
VNQDPRAVRELLRTTLGLHLEAEEAATRHRPGAMPWST